MLLIHQDLFDLKNKELQQNLTLLKSEILNTKQATQSKIVTWKKIKKITWLYLFLLFFSIVFNAAFVLQKARRSLWENIVTGECLSMASNDCKLC